MEVNGCPRMFWSERERVRARGSRYFGSGGGDGLPVLNISTTRLKVKLRITKRAARLSLRAQFKLIHARPGLFKLTDLKYEPLINKVVCL